jgi:hypothetical protein
VRRAELRLSVRTHVVAQRGLEFLGCGFLGGIERRVRRYNLQRAVAQRQFGRRGRHVRRGLELQPLLSPQHLPADRKASCDLALSSDDENSCVILLEELNNVGLCKTDGGA